MLYSHYLHNSARTKRKASRFFLSHFHNTHSSRLRAMFKYEQSKSRAKILTINFFLWLLVLLNIMYMGYVEFHASYRKSTHVHGTKKNVNNNSNNINSTERNSFIKWLLSLKILADEAFLLLVFITNGARIYQNIETIKHYRRLSFLLSCFQSI
jgi:hypothetical protein